AADQTLRGFLAWLLRPAPRNGRGRARPGRPGPGLVHPLIRAALVVMLAGPSSAFLSSLRADPPAPRLHAITPPAVAPLRFMSPSLEDGVVVTCVDAEGNPVVGAEVHLFQYREDAEGRRYVHSGPYRTGEDGTATC